MALKYFSKYFLLPSVITSSSTYFATEYYRNNYMYEIPEDYYLDENKVRVRIWDRIDDKDVGHSSLEILGDDPVYLSVWPSEAVNPKEKNGMVKSTKGVSHSLRIDEKSERREADHIIDIYVSDINGAHEKCTSLIEKVEQGELGYCLSGRSIKGDCVNCTTAVFQALQGGKMDKIPLTDDIITTPGQLLLRVQQAKKNQTNHKSTFCVN